MNEVSATSDNRTLDIITRMVDPALVIGVTAGTLYFAGICYYQAYLGRFGLHISQLQITNLVIGVDGAAAIVSFVLSQAVVLIGMLFGTLAAALFLVLSVKKFAVSKLPNCEEFIAVLCRSMTGAIVFVVVAFSGDYAGKEVAHRRLDAVEKGLGWDYHLTEETVHGVPIVASGTAMWVLTSTGLKLVDLGKMTRIDGKSFQDLKNEK